MPVLLHSAFRAFAEWFCERGVLTAGAMKSPYPPGAQDLRKCRAHFPWPPVQSLGRAFDAILAVVAIGRKQADHLIGAAGGRTRDIAGGEIDGLTNVVFVLQRPLHTQETPVAPTVPLQRLAKKPGGCIAWRRSRWPVTSGHSKCANFAGFSVR